MEEIRRQKEIYEEIKLSARQRAIEEK